MSSKHWMAVTLSLSLALVASLLLLPPWSPVNITSSDTPSHVTGPPAQRASGPEDDLTALQSDTSQSEVAYAVTEPIPSPTPIPMVILTPALGPTSTPPAAPAPTPKLTANPTTTREIEQRDDAGTEQPTSGPSVSTSEARAEESLAQPSQSLEDLIKATEAPIWKVRWDAVNALGELQDPRGIPALVQRSLYDDNPHPRWRSLWALSAVDREAQEAIPLLLEALQDPDPVVVRNAAVALAFFSRPEARPELLHGLEDLDSWRRWEAVFSLKNVGDSEVATALIELLNEETEPDTRVRQESALALGGIGGEGVTSALLTALQSDPSPQVRWRAALALSRLGDPSVVGGLEQALSSEEDPQVRQHIEDATAKLRQS